MPSSRSLSLSSMTRASCCEYFLVLHVDQLTSHLDVNKIQLFLSPRNTNNNQKRKRGEKRKSTQNSQQRRTTTVLRL
jgi:hypothetical protein